MPATATAPATTASSKSPSDNAPPKPAERDPVADAAVVDSVREGAAKSVDAFDKAIAEAIAKSNGQSIAPNPNADAKPGPTRDESGRFAKKGDTDAPADSSDASGGDPAAPSSSAPKYTADQIRSATEALTRYRATKAQLDAVAAGDEDAIAHGLHLAKIQTDATDFSTKHKQLQQELDALKRPAGNTSDDKGKSGATAPQPELDAAVTPLAELLADVSLDGDVSSKVRDSFTALQRLHSAELDKRDQQIASLSDRLDDLAMQAARDDLVSQYPDLKNRETWKKVVAAAKALPEDESRPDLQTRLDHAARIELAPVLAEKARTVRAQRDAGAPTLPNGATNQTKTVSQMSLSELQEASYEAASKGDEQRAAAVQAEIRRRPL